jgi:hypothetical protein
MFIYICIGSSYGDNVGVGSVAKVQKVRGRRRVVVRWRGRICGETSDKKDTDDESYWNNERFLIDLTYIPTDIGVKGVNEKKVPYTGLENGEGLDNNELPDSGYNDKLSLELWQKNISSSADVMLGHIMVHYIYMYIHIYIYMHIYIYDESICNWFL